MARELTLLAVLESGTKEETFVSGEPPHHTRIGMATPERLGLDVEAGIAPVQKVFAGQGFIMQATVGPVGL